jgi:integrase
MIFKRGRVYWIQYWREGRRIRESVKGARLGDRSEATGLKESEARRLLALRTGAIERGEAVGPKIGRLRVPEALAAVVTDYTVNRKRSLDDLEARIRNHLLPHFGGWRMSAITTDAVNAYVAQRLAADAAPATVNRELAILKRAFVLAMRAGTLVSRPHIALLAEDNVRSGFFELEQFEAVRRHLPDAAQRLATFEYVTGWRNYSEVYRLQWPAVDFAGGEVRLPPGQAKNREPRVFPMTVELRQVLVAQRAYVDAIQRERQRIIPWVWVWPDGRPVRDIRGSWKRACVAAGVPGRIPHDFRRTAVRNLERAGVPRSVAMKMVGHKTEGVYRRYAIVAAADLRDAARRLDALADTGVPATKPATVGPKSALPDGRTPAN